MAQFKITKYAGERPVAKRGTVREPNPFDDAVRRSYDEKQAFSVDVPHEAGEDRNGELVAVIKLLRAAAKFVDVGLDTSIIGDTGVWFQAREKLERKAKLPNETQVATEK